MKPALYISIAVILLYWVIFAARQLLQADGPTTPSSVRDISLYVSVKACIVFAVVWFLLRRSDETLADLGFTFDRFRSVMFDGALFAIGVFLSVNVALNTLISTLIGAGTSSATKALFGDPQEAPFWIFTAIIGGGFAEEFLRAFVLTRFDQFFGRLGLAVAVAVDSIVFGLGHLYQGPFGGISAAFTGLMFALIFLRRRRVVDAMIAHAGFDLLGIAAAYALYANKV